MQTYNGWTYTWQNTNQLNVMSNTGNVISYQYNYNGFRTSKTVNGVTTSYTLNGSQITSQTDGTNTLNFIYDSNGKLEYMTLNGTVYYYEKNNQGDVIGLVDSNANEKVTYSYDSYGKILSVGGTLANTVGVLNPFRYRGYYYDNETGMYYLQSRYYNPELSRFISADDPSYHQDYSSPASTNLYAYASNNPVMYTDADGHSTSIPYPGYYIKYNPGSYDYNAKLVQQQLDNVYGYSLDPDGYFGPLTKNAVIDFQNKHSACGGADGIVGPNTWGVLFAVNRVVSKILCKPPSSFLFYLTMEVYTIF